MSESCTSSEIERSVLAEILHYLVIKFSNQLSRLRLEQLLRLSRAQTLIRILIYDLRGNRGFESGLLVEDTNQMIHHMGNIKGFSGFPASMVTIGISSFQIDACHFITNNLLCTNHFFFWELEHDLSSRLKGLIELYLEFYFKSSTVRSSAYIQKWKPNY